MWFWFGFAVLALIGEVMTGTFYLLLFALGLAAAGVTALLAGNLAWQIVTVSVVMAVGLFVLRKTGVLKKSEINAARNVNVNLDIGQTVEVESWTPGNTARVWYRGAYWQAGLAPGAVRQAGSYRIIEIQGSTLLLEPVVPTH
jgi:membrane protein implicated in regulation of membrane protease activity